MRAVPIIDQSVMPTFMQAIRMRGIGMSVRTIRPLSQIRSRLSPPRSMTRIIVRLVVFSRPR